MVDFRSLLQKPAGQAEKPKALPPADYPAVIEKWEAGDQNKNKTPYVRFFFKLTGFPENIDEAEFRKEDGSLIDISKQKFRRDFYLTEDSLYRLDALIHDLGIETAGRVYEDTLPETIGGHVMLEIQQGMNQETNLIYNQVGRVYVVPA